MARFTRSTLALAMPAALGSSTMPWMFAVYWAWAGVAASSRSRTSAAERSARGSTRAVLPDRAADGGHARRDPGVGQHDGPPGQRRRWFRQRSRRSIFCRTLAPTCGRCQATRAAPTRAFMRRDAAAFCSPKRWRQSRRYSRGQPRLGTSPTPSLIVTSRLAVDAFECLVAAVGPVDLDVRDAAAPRPKWRRGSLRSRSSIG